MSGSARALAEREQHEADRPKRLTLSQIVELMLTRSVSRSSVTLTRSASGDTQIDVQVRTGDDGDVAAVEDAEAKAQEVYARLCALYPLPSHEAATVELTRNAKGDTQIDVQAKTSAAVPTIEAARDKAGEVFKTLRLRFPLAGGLHGTGPINDPGEE